MILLLGTDDALLEGLAQLLAGAGRRVRVARSLEEVEEIAAHRQPLLLVVERGSFAVQSGERLARVPLAPGGAVVVYRRSGALAQAQTIPRPLARSTIADLELPLEKNRLSALVASLELRAPKRGALRHDTPPEQRA